MSDAPTRYVIDTSVFIQAYRAYYSFDVCPGFWDSLVSLQKQGLGCSIDKVFEEICFGDEDALTVWAKKSIPRAFFEKTDDGGVIDWFARIQTWANCQHQFSLAAKADFADEADAWLVAHAGSKNLTVVTQEVFSANIQRKIPIPNICIPSALNVKCIDVYTMLRRLGVQLVNK